MYACMQMYPQLESTCMQYLFGHQRYVTDFLPYSLLVLSSEPDPTTTESLFIDPINEINYSLPVPTSEPELPTESKFVHHDTWTQ